MNVLPLFKSHYSLGGSILTLAPAKKLDENYPVSVFDIAKTHGLKEVMLVDESISGFLEAMHSAKKANVKLIFGLKLRCIESINVKNEESLKTLHKIIVFIKNNDGYKDLINISSTASKKGFYYKPNIDAMHLKTMWTKNLSLAIPFYDSFLFMNMMYGHKCIPNFGFTEPTFFTENSDLPFDRLIQGKVADYTKQAGYEAVPTRSIYYYKKEDFLSYLTFRCIHNRTSLEKPELEHCASDWFNFFTWKEQDDGRTVVEI